jgi:hypothetical protein
MKKVAFLVLMLMTVTTTAVKAVSPNDPSHYRDPHTVGAPLDGGLLLILGSAGVAYYASRKQKSKKKE